MKAINSLSHHHRCNHWHPPSHPPVSLSLSPCCNSWHPPTLVSLVLFRLVSQVILLCSWTMSLFVSRFCQVLGQLMSISLLNSFYIRTIAIKAQANCINYDIGRVIVKELIIAWIPTKTPKLITSRSQPNMHGLVLARWYVLPIPPIPHEHFKSEANNICCLFLTLILRDP